MPDYNLLSIKLTSPSDLEGMALISNGKKNQFRREDLDILGTIENKSGNSARKRLTFQEVKQAAYGIPEDQLCASRREGAY